MPPKRRPITDGEVDTESLITAVASQKVIWLEGEPNSENEYLVSKAWDNVACSLACTKQSIQKRWNELKKDKVKLMQKLHEISSRNAGGAASYSAVSMHYADQLGFLDDKQVPAVSKSGNLDALAEKPASIVQVTKPNVTASNSSEDVSLVSTVEVSTESDGEITDKQFCESMQKFMKGLDDQAKLDMRIDIIELLSEFADRIEFSDDEDDITLLGMFTPEK